jgi:hypothetical protein
MPRHSEHSHLSPSNSRTAPASGTALHNAAYAHASPRAHTLIRLLCASLTLIGSLGVAVGGAALWFGSDATAAYADGPIACGPLTQPPDPEAGFCADYDGDSTWYGTYGPGFPTPQGFGMCADPPASGGWFPEPSYGYTPGGAPAGAGGDWNALGFALSAGQAAGWWSGRAGSFTADQAAAAAKVLYDSVVWGTLIPAMDPGVLDAFDDLDSWFIEARGMAAGAPQISASLTTNSGSFTGSATDQIHIQFPGTGRPLVGQALQMSITNGTFLSPTGPTSIVSSTNGAGNIDEGIYATSTAPVTVTVSTGSSMGVAGLTFLHPAPAYSAAQILASFAAPVPVGTTQHLAAIGVPLVKTGTVSIEKAGNDEPYYGVAGAVFQIEKGSTVVATLTTVTSGASPASSQLPVGTYTVHELTSPPGYSTAPAQTITITANQNTVASFTGTDQELIIPSTLTINKADAQGGAPLAGAQFAVSYSTGNNATFDQSLGTCTTDTAGACSPDGNDGAALLPGNYQIQEVAAPPGYYLNPATARQTILLTPGESGTATFSDSTLGSLALTKSGNDTAYASVTGAVFTVTGPAPSVVTVGTLTVGSQGSSNTLTGLVPGPYTVTESSPPPGYQAISPIPVAVADGHATTTLDVLDQVIPATVTLLKSDGQTNAPLAGAILHVAYDPNHSGTYSQDLGTCTTATSGQCSPTGDDGPAALLPGNYQVTEETAPAGYTIDPATATQDITLTPGETGSLTFRDSLLVAAAFVKVATGNVNTALLSLAGATLAVHQGTAGGAVVGTCTTGQNGLCTTAPVLTSGSPYCWAETAAPAGLANGSTGCFTATNAQAAQPITVSDAGLFVAVETKKVDAANTSVTLPGAVLNLYRVDAPATAAPAPTPTPPPNTPTQPGQTWQAQATTGADGLAAFPLQLPGYSYCVVEQHVPANYVLDATPACTGDLTGSAATPPLTTTVTLSDKEATVTLAAHKFNVAVPDTSIPNATYDLYAEGAGPPSPPPAAAPAGVTPEPGDTWYGRATSDQDGNLTFTVPAGYAWCLLEHAAPLDYLPDDALHCSSVLTTSSPPTALTLALPETRATLDLSARKYNSLQPETVIPGATYELVVEGPMPPGFEPAQVPAGDAVPTGDTYWGQATTDSQGLLSFAIPAGYAWCLHELAPPPGYQADPSFHCTSVLTTATSASAATIALPETPVTTVPILAYTGGPSGWIVIGALLMLVGGAGLVLVGRRRRPHVGKAASAPLSLPETS